MHSLRLHPQRSDRRSPRRRIASRGDRLPQGLHRGSKLGDLSQMHQREVPQRLPATIGQPDMHERLARGITSACHKARALRAIDKADNAVVTQHKRL